MLKLNNNWKYTFLRPTLNKIIERYNLKFKPSEQPPRGVFGSRLKVAPLRPRASPQAPPTPVEELPRAKASQKSAQAPKEWPGGGDKVPPVGRPGPPRRLA